MLPVTINRSDADSNKNGDYGYIDLAIEKLNRLNKCSAPNKVLRKLSPSDRNTDVASCIEEIISDCYVEQECWNYVICMWHNYGAVNSKCFKALVARGIPDEFRPNIWRMMANFEITEKLRIMYEQCITQQCTDEDVIEMDIPRTFPKIKGFGESDKSRQHSLFNVTKAYSVYDHDVGYCQGVAFLAGLMLMQMDEFHAFAMLVCIMEQYELKNLYKPSMVKFGVLVTQFEALFKTLMPTLYDHFESSGFGISVICSHFLTLGCNILPLDVVFNMIDLLFIEGFEIVLKVMLAILKLNEQMLLIFNIEELLKFFHTELKLIYKEENQRKILINEALLIPLDQRLMKRTEREYHGKSIHKQKSVIEGKVCCDKESALLKTRIDRLEKENTKLVQDALKERAQIAQLTNENYNLKEENRILKSSLHIQSLELEHLPASNDDDLTELRHFNRRFSSITTADNQSSVDDSEVDSAIDFAEQKQYNSLQKQIKQLELALNTAVRELSTLKDEHEQLKHIKKSMGDHIEWLEYNIVKTNNEQLSDWTNQTEEEMWNEQIKFRTAQNTSGSKTEQPFKRLFNVVSNLF